MKRTISLILSAMLILALLSPGAIASEPETAVFVDSAGRTVEVPRQINKIAVSGPLAQIVVFALCPDKLVGIAAPWDQKAALYLSEKHYNLPLLGQVYGGKNINLEALLQSGAQVVIDVGEPKKSIVEDLDALQEQTQIPFVHITATLSTMGDAYRLLGQLMDMPEEARALADYSETVYAQTYEMAGRLQKTDVLYLTGEQGQHVIAKDSYHAQVIDLLTNNLAVVADPSSRGSGNEVDMEQLLKWNPEVILFSPDSIYASVGEDPIWQQLDAIKDGRYYETPFGPYNWMGFPPSVQCCLGMMWLSKLLYPDDAQYDLYQETAAYFKLFYHSELTEEQYHALVANSIDKP